MTILIEIRDGEVSHPTPVPVIVVNWDHVGYDRADDMDLLEEVRAANIPEADKRRVVDAIKETWDFVLTTAAGS